MDLFALQRTDHLHDFQIVHECGLKRMLVVQRRREAKVYRTRCSILSLLLALRVYTVHQTFDTKTVLPTIYSDTCECQHSPMRLKAKKLLLRRRGFPLSRIGRCTDMAKRFRGRLNYVLV